MLTRWAAWPQGIRWLAGGIAALALVFAVAWVLCFPVADQLAHHDVGSVTGPLHETALDNARSRLLTLGAGLLAAGALWFTARNFDLLRRNSEQADQWQRRTHYGHHSRPATSAGKSKSVNRVARGKAWYGRDESPVRPSRARCRTTRGPGPHPLRLAVRDS